MHNGWFSIHAIIIVMELQAKDLLMSQVLLIFETPTWNNKTR